MNGWPTLQRGTKKDNYLLWSSQLKHPCILSIFSLSLFFFFSLYFFISKCFPPAGFSFASACYSLFLLFSLLYTFLTFLYTLFSWTVSDLTPFPIQWCVWCLIHSGRLINVWGKDRVNERKAFSIWNSASLLWTTAKFHCWASSPGEWSFDSLSE